MDLKLDKIKIQNYKSVYDNELEFNNDSNNTYIFVGKNGTGKSKLLEAITISHHPNNCKYIKLCTKKHQQNLDPIVINYISLVENKRQDYLKEIKQILTAPLGFWQKFKVLSVSQEYALVKGNNSFNNIKKYNLSDIQYTKYAYRIIPKEEITEEKPQLYEIAVKTKDLDNTYKPLTKSFIENSILNAVFNFNINSGLWTPNEKNILNDCIDVSQFRGNPDINIPMKNIFYLAGYKSTQRIASIINEAINDTVQLQTLEFNLSQKTTQYIKEIWKDKDLKINLKISIRKDSNNQYKIYTTLSDEDERNGIYSLEDISDGLKQFISILLGFNVKVGNNNIIAIDEPEVHLHPSAAIYLKEKLLELGQHNYVFFSTHTPFMIDSNVSQRHYKVSKNEGLTNIHRLLPNTNMNDDDLTEELFGINTLRDFYAPNRMLVEGQSEKTIIDFALRLKKSEQCIVITNGKGDNTVQVASYINIKRVNNVLTILDSDSSGIANKNNIIKIGGVFNNTNVFNLKDICPEIPDFATIEDLIDARYISEQYNAFMKDRGYKVTKFIPNEGEAILVQIKKHCSINQINLSDAEIKDLKTLIAENFNIRIGALKNKSPYLNKLADYIIKYFAEINKSQN